MSLYRPKWLKEWKSLIKEEGVKTFIRKKGWKVVLAIILFYTIRDGILYVIIPYFALTELGGCG